MQSLTIGTVGRLDPVKNQAALLHALGAIRNQQPGLAAKIRLVIVGDGPLRAELQSLAVTAGSRSAGDVHWAHAATPLN